MKGRSSQALLLRLLRCTLFCYLICILLQTPEHRPPLDYNIKHVVLFFCRSTTGPVLGSDQRADSYALRGRCVPV